MRVLLLLLLLAACDSPAPRMMGATRTEVVRDGRTYVVYHRDGMVEVIRMGYARRGEHHAIRAEMIDVIGEATGCKPVASSMIGDSGEMRGRLDCPG